jgi:hypothetical protein
MYRSPSSRTRWQVRRHVASAALAMAAALGLGACATATLATATASARNEAVALLPPLNAGEAGWCLLTVREGVESEGCGATRAGFPIIAERLHGGGSPSEVGGIALTTSDVAAVSIDGGHPLPTRPESLLPNGMRAVVWRMPGANANGSQFPPRITPVSAKGATLRQETHGMSVTPGRGGLLIELPTRSISDGGEPERGPCSIEVRSLGGLTTLGGRVISTLKGYPGLVSRAFMVCTTSEYQLHNWPIIASILVEAAHPGANPPALPIMKPVSGHAGTFESLGSEGPVVARPVAGGWLIVWKGKGQAQRLALLDHLRATVDATRVG